MISSCSPISSSCKRMLAIFLLSCSIIVASGSDFRRDFDITWGDGRGKILNNGRVLTLSLDKASGSGFRSKNEYLYGQIETQLKLIPGNSAGTVTTFYLSSKGKTWDEIDFEFLGNLSGSPYTVHTNVITQGKGNREQQFHLWFDPTRDFHTYSFLWNSYNIIFSVDGIPIRVFKNEMRKGVPFPNNQPMRIYSSLWNADDWATQGGRVKTDWTKAPFTAIYRKFKSRACIWSDGASTCGSKSSSSLSNFWLNSRLDSASYKKLRMVQRNFMVYNYCTDPKISPDGLPLECKLR